MARRLEIHYTPKHGSWLDMAEIELNILTRQCLARRIDSIGQLQKEIAVWEKERNSKLTPVHWHFTIDCKDRKSWEIYE